MDAIEAIRDRRMLPRLSDEAPPTAVIEELLDLAVRAPTHHLTQPWRFVVLSGDGRERLARAMADEAVDAKGAEPERALQEARAKVERAPVIVAVTCVPSDDPKVFEQEEFASVAMAIQNILLAAYAKGLGAMLRTGAPSYHPAIRDHLGLDPNEHVVGLVYLGYPVADRALTPREPARQLTRWITGA